MTTPMELVQAFTAAAFVATATRAAWMVLKRFDVRHPPASALPRVEARLTELERSSEAIALELERIGEAQRFTAMLLAERLPPAAGAPGAAASRLARGEAGRVVTPH